MTPSGPSVAIVGIGGIFPDAPDLDSFWNCIRDGHSAARIVPDGRWQLPADEAFSPEVGAADRVYSRTGCFIEELPPASTLPGLAIDPTALEGLDPLFHLLIHAGKRAFDDGITAQLDRSRVGVIIGNLALPSETSATLTRNWLGRTFEEQLLGDSSTPSATSPLPLNNGISAFTSSFPAENTQETTPNALNRYVAGLPAGILAQALGLGGGNVTLDAACASSLYAIKLAVDELLSGRVDAMLSGGVSRPDPLFTQMGFSQLRALSKRGICSPFDAAGDGLVVGEGAGMFLLKRTEDALAHGDRIYGIIRGIGLANDVGGSLLAPMSEGQLRAMRAAYLQAGWDPADVDLVECHATGTPVGDAVEVASLKELWGDAQPSGERCVIGSVKSNIGHLLTAAGGAALTKVLLAMRAGTLPPTAGFNTPQPGMALDTSPFRVLKTSAPWQRRGENVPRRAAVSAFGFGGINAHLLVEEWLPVSGDSTVPATAKDSEDSDGPEPIAVVGMDARFGLWQGLQAFRERVLGGDTGKIPAPPKKWWGVQESAWFRTQRLDRTPFNGFYLDDVSVSSDRFRIPPREMEEMLPQQLLMLQTAAGAMQDAGLGRDDNGSTGVFIGIALDLNSTNFSLRWIPRSQAKAWASRMSRDLSDEELEEWTGGLRQAAGPALNANRTMGALGNIVASRIAREFRIGGPSFTLSSEENSGLHALETAVRMLRTGQLDRALVGAVDLAGDPRAVLGQHALLPFSISGNGRPFDRQADGGTVGEGASAVVLKRLTDAERDGDRIYAVIRGIGTSSNNGYTQALERAYADARIAPATIDYLEASASGHSQQDRNEASALSAFFTSDGSQSRSCAVSSVKGDIGHSGAASGLASFVRGCLALHHEIIPSCRGIEAPCDGFPEAGKLYLPRASRYWLRNRSDGPRRAGVSSCSVDGSSSHVVLEAWDGTSGKDDRGLTAPLGTGGEFLFTLAADTPEDLLAELELLSVIASNNKDSSLSALANTQNSRYRERFLKSLAMALVARNHDELLALVDLGRQTISAAGIIPDTTPALRDRLFFNPTPLGPEAQVAFVFPGSGNHYPGMGMDLFSRWPEILHRQDKENLYLRKQFQPELFWNGAPASEINDDHRAVIFGQVAVGCAVSDLVRSFGVTPSAAIGYSLGESAALFSQRAWRDRDGMYTRMQESTLFTHDLAGECRAARQAWDLTEGEQVHWTLGVAEAPQESVRAALPAFPRAYLLIVNTPDECVIGGDGAAVAGLVASLGCRFFPLQGVTTVHCEVAQPVAQPYHDLHLFPTEPPAGITYYSGVKGGPYEVTRESAAGSILGQALHGIDYPAVIESAYLNGVRLFLEMGPGASCSRMIGRILGDRPHLARSACYGSQDAVSTLLRLLGSLIAERIPVDLAPLSNQASSDPETATSTAAVHVAIGGAPFQPPLPPVAHQDSPSSSRSPWPSPSGRGD